MAEMNWEARFSLVVQGESVPFDEISAMLGLKASRIIRKNDLLNRLPEIHAEADEWFCTIQLTNPDGEDHELNEMLETILKHKTELDALCSRYTVMMRMYNRSDKAMIAYRLMPETLHKLAAVGLPVDVTSLSWGDIGI